MGRWEKRTAAEWDAVFKAQAGSGISAARFCRDQEINYAQFLYFRKKSGGKGRRPYALAMTTAGMVTAVARQHGFVPIRIESGCAMRLKYPRGLVVESDGLLPVSWVTEAAERWLQTGREEC